LADNFARSGNSLDTISPTAAKSYILNYTWTAANFIIEGRMRPYGRRLCTVDLAI